MELHHIAVLAGGALRDNYMDKNDEINDNDIFIHDMSYDTDQIEKIIEEVFPRNDSVVQLFNNEYQTLEEQHNDHGDAKPGCHSLIGDVWEVDEDDFVYQLIFTKRLPEEHINKYFDIGFCKTYCDGIKIRYTDDFLRDVRNKTMTIVGDDMKKEQVMYAIDYHANKLLWKYQDFRLVVPQRYQQFVADEGYPTF